MKESVQVRAPFMFPFKLLQNEGICTGQHPLHFFLSNCFRNEGLFTGPRSLHFFLSNCLRKGGICTGPRSLHFTFQIAPEGVCAGPRSPHLHIWKVTKNTTCSKNPRKYHIETGLHGDMHSFFQPASVFQVYRLWLFFRFGYFLSASALFLKFVRFG